MQTSYSNQPTVGIAGSLRNGVPHKITTHYAEGTTVVGGLAVIAGTAEQQAKVPTAAFTVAFLGVVLHQPERVSQAYAANEQISVAREGVIVVAYEPDTAPTPNTQAYARHTANGAGKLTLGALRANADAANASAIPGGMWRRVFASDGLAELELAGTVN